MRARRNPGTLQVRSRIPAAAFACSIALLCAFACVLRAAENVEFKSVPAALLRVDDSPPKDWNLYTADKRNDRLLLQIGGRYLLVLVSQRRVYELDPAKLEHKQDAVLWRENDRPANALPESEWITHDVGEAYRIHFRLDSEGRVFDIDIPHPVVIQGP